MGISEENRKELMELERTLSALMEKVKIYKNIDEHDVESRMELAKMQLEVGKQTRRLRELRVLI